MAAGVPKGTKLGPWLFLVMINDLDVEDLDLWKFVDDTTMAESVDKSEPSEIQASVDELASKSQVDRFQLNEAKCKELRISFAKTKRDFEPININSKPIDVVPHAKLLGLNISCDLKLNVHISETVRKVSSRLYCLRQLKRAKIATKELIAFYKTCIRPVSEYACQVYHNSLPKYLSDNLEKLQKRALRIILPEKTYAAALESTSLATMLDRRQTLTERLFSDIVSNKDHALHSLLPKVNCADL